MKIYSFLLSLLVVCTLFMGTTEGGPGVAIGCYATCLALCYAGNGMFAGITGGVYVASGGIIYGAAACSGACSAFCAPTVVLPTP